MRVWRLSRGIVPRAALWKGAAVLVTGLIFGSMAAGATLLLPPEYEARTSLLVSPSGGGTPPSYEDLLAGQVLAQIYAALATTRPILSAARDALSLDRDADELADATRAQVSGANPIVEVSVKGSDPEVAARIADEIARQLVAWRPDAGVSGATPADDLNDTLATVDEEIERVRGNPVLRDRLPSLLSTRASLLALLVAEPSNALSVIEPAKAPSQPDRGALLINVAAATVIGVLLAAAVIAAIATRD